MPAIDPSIVVDKAMNDTIRAINKYGGEGIFSLMGKRIFRGAAGTWYFHLENRKEFDVFRLFVYDRVFDTYMRAHYPEFFL